MASICPDPDESPLSQFSSILLPHINSEQDYLPACQSRCSREMEKRRAKSLFYSSVCHGTTGMKMCYDLTLFSWPQIAATAVYAAGEKMIRNKHIHTPPS